MAERFVWLLFLLFPLMMGFLMFQSLRLNRSRRSTAAIQFGLQAIMLTGRVLAFVVANGFLGRVAFAEFLSGCILGVFMKWWVSRGK